MGAQAGCVMTGRPVTLSWEDVFADDEPEDLGWQEKALCAQTDPEAFFPEKGGSTRQAKAVCAICPVTEQCLGYALETDQRFGIWGGLSEQERKRLKRQQGFVSAGLPDGLRRYREGREAEARQRMAAGRKRCSRCGTVKQMDDFARLARSLDGRESECRACRSVRRRVGGQAA